MAEDRCDLLCVDLPRAEAIRRRALPEPLAAEAAARAAALGDPTRLAVASALAEGDELCVCDLAWIAGRSQQLVAHHLRRLREAGLVASRRDGKLLLCRLTGEGRALLDAVLPALTPA